MTHLRVRDSDSPAMGTRKDRAARKLLTFFVQVRPFTHTLSVMKARAWSQDKTKRN